MTVGHDTVLLLNAYQDGELSPGEALDMESRLAADPDLRAYADRLGGLSARLRQTFADVAVPPTLRAGVHRRGGMAEPAGRGLRRLRQPLAAAILVGFLAGGAIGGGAVYLGLRGRPVTDDAVLAGHLRGLAAPQPFDIASSDRHVVKPWFNGRTVVAPSAPDLAENGFPLMGGRIDIVGGQPVPTLVYRRDRHVISVTIAPDTDGGAAAEEHRDGTVIERWSAGDLTYWAVSDLNSRDLRTFADLFRTRTARDG